MTIKSRPIDAKALSDKIHEYMRNFPNATARLTACRAILSMLGDENQTPTQVEYFPDSAVNEKRMTLNEYQSLASRTINKDMSCYEILMHSLHEIAAECGEIHGIFQKLYQGHKLDENALMLEVGDLLWGIAELCSVNSWNLADVAQANIEKLERRYPDGFSEERSRNRQEE